MAGAEAEVAEVAVAEAAEVAEAEAAVEVEAEAEEVVVEAAAVARPAACRRRRHGSASTPRAWSRRGRSGDPRPSRAASRCRSEPSSATRP